jgi:hypothetical protein
VILDVPLDGTLVDVTGKGAGRHPDPARVVRSVRALSPLSSTHAKALPSPGNRGFVDR